MHVIILFIFLSQFVSLLLIFPFFWDNKIVMLSQKMNDYDEKNDGTVVVASTIEEEKNEKPIKKTKSYDNDEDDNQKETKYKKKRKNKKKKKSKKKDDIIYNIIATNTSIIDMNNDDVAIAANTTTTTTTTTITTTKQSSTVSSSLTVENILLEISEKRKKLKKTSCEDMNGGDGVKRSEQIYTRIVDRKSHDKKYFKAKKDLLETVHKYYEYNQFRKMEEIIHESRLQSKENNIMDEEEEMDREMRFKYYCFKESKLWKKLKKNMVMAKKFGLAFNDYVVEDAFNTCKGMTTHSGHTDSESSDYDADSLVEKVFSFSTDDENEEVEGEKKNCCSCSCCFF